MRRSGWCATACAIAVVLLTGCGQPSLAGDGDLVDVVVSTSVLADLVALVGGDLVEVHAIVPVGGDPHVFEARPSDARRLADADLVVINGLGLEPWADPLLATRSGPVAVLGTAEGSREADGAVDPHRWMVPAHVAEVYVPAIRDALAELRPDDVDVLHAQADAAAAELHALHEEVAAILAPIPEDRRLLVTSHDAYGYFAEAFDLTVVGTVVGTSTEEEPSARTVAALIDVIGELGVPTVFIETTVNPAVLRRIAADAGVEVGEPLYGDSLGEPGSGAETYADMLRTNARHILEGLR